MPCVLAVATRGAIEPGWAEGCSSFPGLATGTPPALDVTSIVVHTRPPGPLWAMTVSGSLRRTGRAGPGTANRGQALQPDSRSRHATTLNAKVRDMITASLLVMRGPCLFSHAGITGPWGASGSRWAATGVRIDWGAHSQTVETHDRRFCRRRPLTWGFSHIFSGPQLHAVPCVKAWCRSRTEEVKEVRYSHLHH